MMDCLYAACTPIITDCVMAELEKLGPKYRLALQIARDERFERSSCDHKGTYADDCIVDRIMKHRIYIVATNDKDLCESYHVLDQHPWLISSVVSCPIQY
jgi:U3 small nucleolar RNA-associated protein 24